MMRTETLRFDSMTQALPIIRDSERDGFAVRQIFGIGEYALVVVFETDQPLPEPMTTIAERLEYLRGEIRAERISMGEIVELQGLAEHITPGDVELLEWAGVPEHPDEEDEPGALGDVEAIEQIAHLLRAEEWPGASGMEDIAEIVARTGRDLTADPEIEWRSH